MKIDEQSLGRSDEPHPALPADDAVPGANHRGMRSRSRVRLGCHVSRVLVVAGLVLAGGCIAPLEPHPRLNVLEWSPPPGTGDAQRAACQSGMAAALIARQIHAPVERAATVTRPLDLPSAGAAGKARSVLLSIGFPQASQAVLDLRDTVTGKPLWQASWPVRYRISTATCRDLVQRTLDALRSDHIVIGTDPLTPGLGPAFGSHAGAAAAFNSSV